MKENEAKVTENKQPKKVFVFGKKKENDNKKEFKKKPEKPATDQNDSEQQDGKFKKKKRVVHEGYPLMSILDEKSKAALLSFAK